MNLLQYMLCFGRRSASWMASSATHYRASCWTLFFLENREKSWKTSLRRWLLKNLWIVSSKSGSPMSFVHFFDQYHHQALRRTLGGTIQVCEITIRTLHVLKDMVEHPGGVFPVSFETPSKHAPKNPWDSPSSLPITSPSSSDEDLYSATRLEPVPDIDLDSIDLSRKSPPPISRETKPKPGLQRDIKQ